MAESMSDKLLALAEQAKTHEAVVSQLLTERDKWRWQAGVLWDVAREGLPKGDAYYNVVAQRMGQHTADEDRKRDASAGNAGVGAAHHQPKPPPPTAEGSRHE